MNLRRLGPCCFLAWILTGWSLPQTVWAALEHSGTLSEHSTWTSQEVHRITGNVTVAPGVILTIEPGAIVKFNAGRQLRVNGALEAVGLPGAEIYFTSHRDDSVGGDTNGDGPSVGQPGDWATLLFSSQVAVDLTRIERVVVRYGGSNAAAINLANVPIAVRSSEITHSLQSGIYVSAVDPVLEHNTITDCGAHGINLNHAGTRVLENTVTDNVGAGIYVRYAASSGGVPEIRGNTLRGNQHGIQVLSGAVPEIHDNVITGNREWGILQTSGHATPVITGNTMTGNQRGAKLPATAVPSVSDGNTLLPNRDSGLWIIGANRPTDLTLEVMTSDGGAAELNTYHVTGTFTVGTDTTLTIRPGVVVKFAAGAGLTISGQLMALGEVAAPIAFTSELDDTFGGDLNRDGYAARPTRGQWGNLHFTGNSTGNVIEHAVVRYAGGHGEAIEAGGDLTLRHTHIAESSRDGIYTYNSDLTLEACEITGNLRHGVFSNGGGTVSIVGGRIFANGADGVQITGNPAVTVTGAEIFGNSGFGVHAGNLMVAAADNWWGAADGPGGEGSGSGDEISANVDLGVGGIDFRPDGSAFSHLDAGANTGGGPFGLPVVVQGTDTIEWGTEPANSVLYDLDAVILDYGIVSTTARLETVFTTVNKDNATAVGGNFQHLEEGHGQILENSRAVSSNTPDLTRQVLPITSHTNGPLALHFVRDRGFRSVVSEVWLIEHHRAAGDEDPPISMILSPDVGDRLAGTQFDVEGQTQDESRIERIELGIDAGNGMVWAPATERRGDGGWRYEWTPPGDGTYTLLARAVDEAGNVEISTAEIAGIEVTVDSRPPAPVRGLVAADVPGDAGGQISVTWSRSVDDGAGEADVIAYGIERRESGSAPFVRLDTLPAQTESLLDQTPIDGTLYDYRVVTEDGAGNASISDVYGPIRSFDNVGTADDTPPEEVTQLQAIAGSGFVRLSWTPSVDSELDLRDQLLDVSTDDGITWGIEAPDYQDGGSVPLGKAVTTYFVSGLDNDRGYRFRVRVRDSFGNVSAGVSTGEVTPSADAYTTVSGVIGTDTVWDSGVYYVQHEITVASEATLTLAPGVIVKFAPGRSLRVDGGLVAVGQADNPVVFTAFADDTVGGDNNGDGPSEGTPGAWGTLELRGANTDAVSRLEHAIVRFGGTVSVAGSIRLIGADVPVVDCEITHGGSHGLVISNASPLIANNQITDHQGPGVYVAGVSQPTVIDNTIERSENGVHVVSGTPEMRDNQIRDNQGYGILFNGGTNAPEITGNVIIGNERLVRLPLSAVPGVHAGNVMGPNGVDLIEIHGNVLTRNLELRPDVPYWQITGWANVGTGAQLKLQPGVIWKFNSGTGVWVSGALQARGTADAQIVMTSYRDDTMGGDTDGSGPSVGQRGDWLGVELQSTVIEFLSGFEHVAVRYAGGRTANISMSYVGVPVVSCELTDSASHGLYLYAADTIVEHNTITGNGNYGIAAHGTPVRIAHNTITHNDGLGIQLRSAAPGGARATVIDNTIAANLRGIELQSGAVAEIHDNIIRDHQEWGIFQSSLHATPVITGNRITGNLRSAQLPVTAVPNPTDGNVLVPNAINGLWILGSNRDRDLTLAVLHGDGGVGELNAYHLSGTLTMAADTTLTIEAGAVVKLAVSAGLTVHGRLAAVGQAAAPIAFTSEWDDTLGGDLNQDGQSTLPSPGDWGGLYLTGLSGDPEPSLLEHVIIRYGGQWGENIDAAGPVQIRNARIEGSNRDGIYVRSTEATLEDCEISGNVRHGLYVTGATTLTMTRGRIYANSGDGIQVSGNANVTVSGAEIFGNIGYGIRGGNAPVTAMENWWGATDGPGGAGPGAGDEVSDNVDYALGELSFETVGSAFSYLDAGPNLSEGSLGTLAVLQGTATTEWGETASTRALYDLDAVILDYGVLETPARLEVLFTSINKDDTSTIGGNIQHLEDHEGRHLHGPLAVPSVTPRLTRLLLPRTAHQGGPMGLHFMRDNGYRAAVSQVWLVENVGLAGDDAPPVSMITQPGHGDRLAGTLVEIQGQTLDDSVLGAVEIGIDAGNGPLWVPVSELRTDHTWRHRWTRPGDGTYSLMVRAVDEAGNREIPGPAVVVTLDNQPPAAITLLAAHDTPDDTGGSITLGWTLSTDDGAGTDDVATYAIERRASDVATFEDLGEQPAGADHFVDDTPIDGTHYDYRVVAIDQAGNVSPSDEVGPIVSIDNASTPDDQAPEDVTDLQATAGSGRVRLSWTLSADTGLDLVNQQLDVSSDGGLSWGLVAPDYDDGGTQVVSKAQPSYLFDNLENGQAVRFRVRVRDASGNVSVGTQTPEIMPSAGAYTTVSGAINADTTWASGIYYIQSDVTVGAQATLTIAPGVIVKLGRARSLRVDGALVAVGQPGQPVVFTAFADDSFGGDTDGGGPSVGAPGDWGTLEFRSGADGGVSRIEHALIRYGGSASGAVRLVSAAVPIADSEIVYGSSYGLVISNCSPEVTDNLVTDHALAGIYVVGASSPVLSGNVLERNDQGIYSHSATPTIADNQIRDNVSHGIYFAGGPVAPEITGNVIVNNGALVRLPFSALPGVDAGNVMGPNTVDVIEIIGNALGRNLDLPAERPYYQVSGWSTVGRGAQLRIQPGVVWKFMRGTGLWVEGAVTARGTAGAPIVFTSYQDDSVAGDTNDNGPSVGQRGDWLGIEVTSTAIDFLSLFEHAVVRYGGARTAGIAMSGVGVAVRSTEITDSLNHGIYVYNAHPSFEHNTIAGCGGHGIYAHSSAPVIAHNTITGGDGSGLFVNYPVATGARPDVRSNTITGNLNGIALYSSATAEVHDNVITGHREWGIYQTNGALMPVITGNTLTGNLRPAQLSAAATPSPTDGNVLVPNEMNALWIIGSARSRDLALDVLTGEGQELRTYHITGTLTQAQDTSLTVAPRVVVKLASSGALTIGGRLLAIGEADAPIVFTSELDDDFGGDLNGDGYATRPSRGAWNNIYLTATSTGSALEHVVLRYGGRNGNILDVRGPLALSHGRITHSSRDGIFAWTAAVDLLVEDCEIYGNARHGLYLGTGGTATVTGGRLFANEGDAILLASNVSLELSETEIFANAGYGLRAASQPVSATDIWWGAFDGPGGEGPGSGDEVSVNVDFSDFRPDGTEYGYFDAGGHAHEGHGVDVPNTTGQSSTAWGEDRERSILVSDDGSRITAEYAGLSGDRTYRLWVTYLNRDAGGGVQTLTRLDGSPIHEALSLPTSTPMPYEYLIPAISGGRLVLNFDAVEGDRTMVSAILLLAGPANDAPPPEIAIDTPPDGTYYAGDVAEILVQGQATDVARLTRVELGFEQPGVPPTWTSVSILDDEGRWSYRWMDPPSGHYTLTARAIDTLGNRGLSAPITVVVDDDPPQPVSALAVYSVAQGLRLYWERSGDDGQGANDVVSYLILRRQGDAGPWVEAQTVMPGIEQFDDIDVEIGEPYFYVVRTLDRAGNFTDSAMVGPAEPQAEQDLTPPEDATNLAATASHRGADASAYLTWRVSANTAGDLIVQKLYVSVDGSGVEGNNAPAFDNGLPYSLSRTRQSFYLAGLAVGQSYTFRVTSVDAVPNESAGATVTLPITGDATEYITFDGTLSHSVRLGPGVYHFRGVTVPADVLLELGPGTTIKFSSRGRVTVNGAMSAVGVEGDPVIFTALADDTAGGDTNGDGPSEGAPGSWDYLYYTATSDATLSRLEHIEARYGGYQTGFVYLYRTDVPIVSSVFTDSASSGIYIYETGPLIEGNTITGSGESGIRIAAGSGAPVARRGDAQLRGNLITGSGQHGIYAQRTIPAITNNQITHNAQFGIYFTTNLAAPAITGNIVTDNDVAVRAPANALPDETNTLTPNARPYIGVVGNPLDRDVGLHIWGAGTPGEMRTYVIESGGVTVPEGWRMTLDPGVIVKLYAGLAITVAGALEANGTLEEKIVLTGINDHRIGGNPMGLADVALVNGQWGSVRFNDVPVESGSRLDHVIVRFAGASNNSAVLLVRSDVPITNSEISNSVNLGLRIYDASPEITGNSIWGNDKDGIYLERGQTDAMLMFNRIWGNGSDGIEIYNGARSTATNNQIFANLDRGLYNRTSNLIDATQCWWGDADGSGPFHASTNPDGTGSTVSDQVTYAPYLAEIGTAYVYQNFSATTGSVSGTLPGPTIVQGEPSDMWDAAQTRVGRTMVWHPDRVILAFEGLDAEQRYDVRVTYFNGEPAESYQSLRDGADHLIHDAMLMPRTRSVQHTLAIPPAYISGEGALTLQIVNENPESSLRTAISEILLLEHVGEVTPPRFTGVAYNDIDGSDTLTVGDAFHFRFSEAMDTTQLVDGTTDANTRMATPGDRTYGITNSIRWSADEQTVIVTLTEGFTLLGGELVSPTAEMTDRHGNEAVGQQMLPTLDTLAPRFIAVDWIDVDGNGRGSLGDQHRFTFDEAMAQDAINDGTVDANTHLRPQGGTRYGDINPIVWSADGRQVTVTLTAGFTVLGNELVLPSSFVTDVAGNPVMGTQQLSGRDETPPEIVDIVFDDANGDGALSIGDRFRFRFSEAMRTFALSDGTAEANVNLPPGDRRYGHLMPIDWNPEATAVSVEVSSGFTLEGHETVNPSDLLMDLAGNPIANVGTLDLNDRQAPAVVRVRGKYLSPLSATEDYRLTVQFSNRMDPAVEPVVEMESTGGESPVVPAGGEWLTTRFQNDTYTTPDIALRPGMDGTLQIHVAAGRDTAGNEMDAARNVYAVELDATPPDNPGVTVSALDCSSARLRWQGYAAPGDLAGFHIYQSTLGPFAEVDGRTFLHTTEAGARHFDLSGLIPDTVHHVAVVAFDEVGNFTRQVDTHEILIERPVPPPVAVTVSPGLDPDSAVVTWPYDTHQICGVEGFQVFVELADFADVDGRVPFATVGPDIRQLSLDGLDRTARYFVAVVAVNTQGERDSAVVTAEWSDPYAGEIDADITLGGGEQRDLLIRASIVVTGNATLTITPGTRLRFAADTRLTVRQGRILAEGTPFLPITLTSAPAEGSEPAPGDWGGVYLEAAAGGSVLRHVRVEYGGGLHLQGCAPTVDAFTARHNLGAGLALTAGAVLDTVEALLSYNGIGARIETGGRLTLSGSVIKTNGVNAISDGSEPLSAEGNWWGSDDADAVATDNAGPVEILPILPDEPVLSAAIGLAGGEGEAMAVVAEPRVDLLLPGRNAIEMRISEDEGFEGVFFEPWQPTATFALSPHGGEKTLFAQFRSVTGLDSPTVSVSVRYVTDRPIVEAFSLVDGQIIHRPLTVTAEGSATLGVTAVELDVNGAILHEIAGPNLTHRWDVRLIGNGTHQASVHVHP